MSTIERPCHRCGASLPHSMMERVLHPDWHKFVYFCRACVKAMDQEDRERERLAREKAKACSQHVNWWDKPKHQ